MIAEKFRYQFGNMVTIENKTFAVLDHMVANGGDKKYCQQIGSILLIISIIISLIQIFMQCSKTADEIASDMREPGWFYKWRLKRLVNRKLTDIDLEHSSLIYQGLVQTGSNITKEEVEQIISEINQCSNL